MARPKILLQLDTDLNPSVFDSVVAVDSGVEQVFRQGGVTPETVRDLVYGAIFTRGGDDLKSTAIFIGGSDVAAGERLLKAVTAVFFGPMRVSVMLDSNGANTTAAAAVAAARRHLSLDTIEALVLAATGPVGSRVVRLLAEAGAAVRVASRTRLRAEATCTAIRARVPDARLSVVATDSAEALKRASDGVDLVVAAGAPGVEILPDSLRKSSRIRVAIDLSAVPPLGIGGIEVTDKGRERDGVLGYGALGVGGLKMKIHKAALAKLFSTNTLVLDAEEVDRIGREL